MESLYQCQVKTYFLIGIQNRKNKTWDIFAKVSRNIEEDMPVWLTKITQQGIFYEIANTLDQQNI